MRKKIKTHKATVKRFKVSATGKVSHYRQGDNHLKANKNRLQKKRGKGRVQLGSKNQSKKIVNLMNIQ